MSRTQQQRLTRQEAAHRLGVSIRRVDQYRRLGLLDWERNEITRRVSIPVASINKLAAQRKAGVWA